MTEPGTKMALTKEHKIAVVVAIITLALIFVVTVLRNGTSW